MPEQAIYYVYLKATGEFMGSGTPYFDDATYGCTTEPTPEFDSETQQAWWSGEAWSIAEK